MGFLFVGSVGVVPQWFSKHRSVANGVATGGSGIGGMVYSLAANSMIQNLGLGWAFRILAIVQFTANFLSTVIIRDRNKQVGSTNLAFDYRLFKKWEFLLVLGWGIFSMLGYIVLLFSLPDFAQSVGLTARQGSIINAVMQLGQGLGRPVVGIFSDGAGRINMAGFMTFFCGLICFLIWIFAKTYGVLLFFAFLVGTVAGTFWTCIGPVGAEVLGLKELASGLSITWLILVIPTTFAEPIALKLRQSTGNIYLHAQLFTAFMYIGAALCMLFLRGWKIGQVQSKDGVEEKSHEVLASTESGEAGHDKRTNRVRRLFMFRRV
ncbi:MAG: hypothetical protein M1833_007136 [Piccolia ochrophora]|nr:MAG: hypothetical protein M1833_007136 [Piccolia ochrophora]